jgi:8-oxo-dGTP pyrophosphatase MutT (NUDIX family)
MPTPEFILRLRELIGRELLWLPAACSVVLREGAAGDEVLLVRRSDNGWWTPVGGIIDPGEHPADAAEREVLEETGVRCVVEGLASVTAGTPLVYENGDEVQFLTHVFRCRPVEGEARVADEESIAVGWFPLDGLPEMLPHFVDRIADAVGYDGTTRLPRRPEQSAG